MTAYQQPEAAMLSALLTIFGFQLAGEVIARSSGLPIPGPVLGMAGLLIALSALPALRDRIRPVADGLLGNLSLLFVPAGVGAAQNLMHLGSNLLPVLVAVFASTILAIMAGALSFAAVARATGNRAEDAA